MSERMLRWCSSMTITSGIRQVPRLGLFPEHRPKVGVISAEVGLTHRLAGKTLGRPEWANRLHVIGKTGDSFAEIPKS